MPFDLHTQSKSSTPTVLIIGAGFSGLCMGIRLKKAGIESFTILERGSEIGGTWRDNVYPGCACDVQSHLYSFSFEPNPKWTRMFAPQDEIQDYLLHCTEKYALRPHIRFGQDMVSAQYDEARQLWTARTSTGEVYEARVIVSSMGALSNPLVPKLPGAELFQGKTFHSAHWDHDYDLRGKRVAVLGTGASAIQFVPAIAPKAAQLDVYQRTPPWVLPKPDRQIGQLEHDMFAQLPWTQALWRRWLYWLLELRVFGLVVNQRLMDYVQRDAVAYLESEIKDPEFRRKLTPNYRIGCKRVLLSNDWYPALRRSNVNVISEAAREITARGVVASDGREREVDAIIYGTGFDVRNFVKPGAYRGKDGRDLADVWKDGPKAYKGTTVAGFPNLFFLVGPNTGIGHSSLVFMIESQVAYVMDTLKQMQARGWSSVEVCQQAQDSYNTALQKKSPTSVWQSGCRSWYLDEKGQNHFLWTDFTFRFRRLTARFDSAAYTVCKDGQRITSS